MSTEAAPSSSTSSDKDNNFKVLASGTQDLAALVGIFAADSVEPYAFNYSRGWLSPLGATLSLLGLLGYIRGLVKLALGREGCLRAKFNIDAERTFFGFLDQDWLPPGALHQVTYLQRERHTDHVIWSTHRRIKHTSESMPILRVALSGLTSTDTNVVVNTCQLEYKIKHFRSGYGHFVVPLVSAIFVGVTTLAIIPLRTHPREMSWSWYFATIGEFLSIFASFMLWSWVYAQEMLPHHRSEWADRAPCDAHHSRSSLEKRDYFAFIQKGNRFVTFDLRAIKGKIRWLVRVTSFATAVLALFSYICQYIELSAMSPQRSAIWLGIQGVLALLRVSLWVVDPGFDDLKDDSEDPQTWHTEPVISMSEEKLLLLRLDKLHSSESLLVDPSTMCPPEPDNVESGVPHHGSPLAIPSWVLPVLDLSEAELARAFELAYSLYSEPAETTSWKSALDIFRNCCRAWDFPIGFLGRWMEAHTSRAFDLDPLLDESAIGCRVIQDKHGRFHYLPYCQRAGHTHQIFGDPRVEEKTIYTAAMANMDSAELVLAHREGLRIGWPALPHTDSMSTGVSPVVVSRANRKGSGLSLKKLNTRTTDMVSEVVGMWDDLIGILRREKTVVFRRQVEFLRDVNDMGIGGKRGKVVQKKEWESVDP